VVAAARRLLRPGGWLLVELGADQDTTLAPALHDDGFDTVEAWHDDEGDLRGVATRWTGRTPSSSTETTF
jgi:methylase of polypeptide subunit release factors